ncbi:MAG: hypothetical protein P1Q69_21490, partial [Candidatus Thorarchaeota archaeon]|nr:hypothetical protein [Candidatus Thorarchaeota archaeon]
MKYNIAESIPISWICKSEKLKTYLETIGNEKILIADFAAGENDEIPFFIHNMMLECLEIGYLIPMIVYCTDLHILRIESLFDKLLEHNLEKHTRIVFSRFETMTEDASFPDIQKEYLKKGESSSNFLDKAIIEK